MGVYHLMGLGLSPGTVIGPLTYELLTAGPVALDDLYSTLRNNYWDLSRGLTSPEVLREEYLASLWKQGLIAEADGGYVVGPQWELILPYQESLRQVREATLSIEQLAERETWIEREKIVLMS